jgi:hypothetical protein
MYLREMGFYVRNCLELLRMRPIAGLCTSNAEVEGSVFRW